MTDDSFRGATREAWSLLSVALDPAAPRPEARARLMAAIDGPRRYVPFARELAAHFDLPWERVCSLLARIDGAEGWTRGVAPILGFLHFRPGPGLPSLHGGFVRMQSGAGFPLHRHRDRELTFVLEGTLTDGEGQCYGPGQALEMPPGSAHALRVVEGEDALIALLHGGIEMLGQ